MWYSNESNGKWVWEHFDIGLRTRLCKRRNLSKNEAQFFVCNELFFFSAGTTMALWSVERALFFGRATVSMNSTLQYLFWVILILFILIHNAYRAIALHFEYDKSSSYHVNVCENSWWHERKISKICFMSTCKKYPLVVHFTRFKSRLQTCNKYIALWRFSSLTFLLKTTKWP
jgi:hypothetical protein